MNITGISPYGVYPPISGTHKRIFYLNLFAVKKGHNVLIFSQSVRPFEKKYLLQRGFGTWKIEIIQNYVEYRWVNPTSLASSWFFHKLGLQPPILADTMLKIFKPRTFYELLHNSDIVKVEFPWQASAVSQALSKANSNVPTILVEHNVEFDLINQIIQQKALSKGMYSRLLKIVFTKEQQALEFSDHVIAVSEMDKERIHELYGIPRNKISIVPNGVCIEEYTIPSPEKKAFLKKKLGVEGKTVLLFVGFEYYPNMLAAEYLVKLSEQLPRDCVLLIVGSVGNYLKSTHVPNNVIITGYVDDVKPYFQVADIALNPITIGGGSNIKMFEYMASGLPVLTTPLGARGILGAKNYKNIVISEPEEFLKSLEELIENKTLRETIGRQARELVTQEYSWETLAERELKVIHSMRHRGGSTP